MKAEELKQGAKRTDVAFTSSSFLPDEPTYCFTEDELQKYADEVSRENNKKTAVGFIWAYSDISSDFTYKQVEKLYDKWFKEQEE